MDEHKHTNRTSDSDGLSEEEKTPHTLREGSEQDEQSIGPAIGIIVIIVLLILGGLYLWGQKMQKRGTGAQQDEQLRQLQTVSSSTELEAIERDLERTELDGIDTELEQIEQELNF